MDWLCRMTGHLSGAAVTYNGGYYFTTCARCRHDLLRSSDSSWERPRKGYRISWRAGAHSHAIAPDLARVLPIAVTESQVPARPGRFVSWSRSLGRLRSPVASAVRSVATEEEADYSRPGLLLLAVLFGVGLKLIIDPGRW